MKVQSRILAAMCAAGVVAGTAHAATVNVASDVTVNETWYRTNTYVLTQPIYVTGGATLTIQDGTLIRGEAGNTNSATAPGALIVSYDGTIMANGSATAPIVFTDMTDDHFVGPTPVAGTAPYDQANNAIGGKWGGVIILGQTYLAHNNATVQIEGLEPAGAKSTYGGTDDNDNSGQFTFVSIRHGGYVIGKSNEINGLTMGGVGRGTKIQNIEVYQTLDDGFEWFGGTVDTKYLVSWSYGDDGFDWDEGFRGRGQFWLAVKGLVYNDDKAGYDVSDHGAEMDGSGKVDNNNPQSLPTIYNATFIGHGASSTNSGFAGTMDLCWLFRDGTGGRYVNSMALDFGGALALIEGNLTDGKTYNPSYKTQQLYTRDTSYTHYQDGMNKLDVRGSVFWGVNYADAKACSNGVTSGVFSGKGYWGGDDDKDHLGAENGYTLLDGKMNVELPRAYEAEPINVLQRDVTATAGVYPVVYLDPLAIDGRYTSSMMPPSSIADTTKFYSPVAFQGAFGGKNWAAWMDVAKLGLMPADNYGMFETSPGGNYTNDMVQTITVETEGTNTYLSFFMDPTAVHEGYVADVTIGYYTTTTPKIWYGYNFDTGIFQNRIGNIKTMPLRKMDMKRIIMTNGMPAGTQFFFIADTTPNQLWDASNRFWRQSLTL